jgi:hypothetical protein
MEFPMKNSDLQNIAIAFETEQENEAIENIVNSIKEQIITVAYSQSGREFEKYNGVSRNVSKKEIQRGDPRQIIGHNNKVMDKKLTIPIQNLYNLSVPKLSHVKMLSQVYKIIDFKDYVPEIISKVQQLFPQMKILVDPLNTYILFDWS